MKFIKVISLLGFLFILNIFSFAQVKYEYGAVAEFKGLKKVFFNTQTGKKDRKTIISRIKEANLRLEIVEDEADAEIIIMFATGKEKQRVTRLDGGRRFPTIAVTEENSSVTMEETFDTGTGYVFVIKKDKSTPRMLMKFKLSQHPETEEDPPVFKFTDRFIENYKAANGLK